MRPSRHDIVELLQRDADAATPPIDSVFVEQLDRRLRSIDLSAGKPRRRVIGRAALLAVVVATATAGVAAAAAAVISWHGSPTRPPATEPIVRDTAPKSTPLPSTTVASPTNDANPPTISVAATTTALSPTTSTVAATTTVTATTAVPPTTAPPTTSVQPTVAPSSTEVRVPATLTLACTPAGGAITCSWDPGPVGTTHYALLRTDSASSQGRVFTPEPGSVMYVDSLVTVGTTYVYLVHALDDSGHSLAHSNSTSTPCCG